MRLQNSKPKTHCCINYIHHYVTSLMSHAGTRKREHPGPKHYLSLMSHTEVQ